MTNDLETVSDRVSQIEPGIFLLREVPNGTIDTWHKMEARLNDLTVDERRWGLVIDLTDVEGRPKGEYREAIGKTLANTSAQHIAIVQPGNLLLRSVLRFIIGNVTDHSSVHRDLEAGLETLRARLAIAVGG